MHSTRYAHSEGYTDICITDDGKKIITCGEDGDVRIWNGFDDIDNISITVGEKCYCLTQKLSKLYICNELNEIKCYDLNTNELIDTITTLPTLPATCLAINKSNTQLFCGCADFEIRIIDLATHKITTFNGHNAPILNVCIDPFEKYFLSSSCDGTIKIWSVKNENLVKTLENIHKKSNDFNNSKTYAKISWHKDANLIAIPSNKEILFYERELWQLKFKINIKVDDSNDDFVASIIQFSPNGKNVLVITNNNYLFVHSIITKSVLFRYKYTSSNSSICSIAWNQVNDSELIFCDNKGQMGNVKIKLYESDEPSSGVSNDENMKIEQLLDLIDDDDEDDEIIVNKLSKKKNDAASNNKNSSLRSPNKKRKRTSSNEGSESTMTNDTDEFESLEKLKESTYNLAKKDHEMILEDEKEDDFLKRMSDSDSNMNRATTSSVSVKLQIENPFQPSSTPLTYNERFMCWNSVGIVTQYNKDDDKSIDIEFHNVSYHHAIHYNNNMEYFTLADLSKEAVLLASTSSSVLSDDSETSSNKLLCILLNPWDSGNKEWSLTMPKKESIKCICVSEKLCACVTNNKFLRIFSLNGAQKQILALPALSFLTMAAFSNLIFVAYYTSYTATVNDERQQHSIGYSLIYTDLDNDSTKLKCENGLLPLSDKSKLYWLGFSDEATPAYYDTNGFLYMKSASSNTWFPVTNLRSTLKHKSDNYWIVGIAERTQTIKTILCKSSSYPLIAQQRPTINLITIQLPLCELNSEKSQLEQDYWKALTISQNLNKYVPSTGNIEIDQDDLTEVIEKLTKSSRETIMKLFVLSCKANKEQRAYEFATMMDSFTLKLAIKYATKARYLLLAQHLNALAEAKATAEFELEQQNSKKESSYVNKYREISNDNIKEQKENINQNADIVYLPTTKTQTQQLETLTANSAVESQQIQSTTDTINDSLSGYLTPSAIPLTNTRFNPFKTQSESLKESNSRKEIGSPSILNEIEDKLLKHQKDSATPKEKDVWKPTPTRKLTKNKVTSNNTTPNSNFKLDSFFNSNKNGSP